MRGQKQILIVDDDDAIRALLMTVLRRRGLHADAARNGVEAVEKLALRNYDVMLLDLMMPQMSGYDVLDHLAQQPVASRPLVLVLTAGLEPRPLDPRIVVGTMNKPFDVELLVDTVIGCLSAKGGVPQSAPAKLQSQADEAN